MRVRVAYTIDVSDDYRRAIRAHYDKDGLATRAEVQGWLRRFGESEDENLMWDLENDGSGERRLTHRRGGSDG